MQIPYGVLIGASAIFSILILAICAWQACKIESWFRHLELKDFRVPGPQPKTEAGLDKRIKAATKFRWAQLGRTAIQMTALFIFVAAIPTALLFVATKNYPILAPHHYGFLIHGTPSSALTAPQLDAFIFSQFIRGTLLDTIEIFNVDFSAVSYQRTDFPITLIVFIYRLFVELFAAGFFVAVARFTLLLARETPGIRYLRWRRSLGGQIGRA